MARNAGISGVGVAAATTGALLMYAGIRDVSVLDTLREVTGGKLPEGNRAREGQPSAAASAARAALAGGASGGTSGGVIPAVTGGSLPELANAALRYRGVPYRFGGNTPSGLDCSGLVQLSFADIGIQAPRTTYTQQPWRALRTIDASQAGAGDLVYWPGHCAIVVSPGTVVHAPRTGRTVEVVPVGSAGPRGLTPVYKRYVGAKPKAKPKTAQV
jgi:cell wall-associated NlpC family hydrolase